MAGLVDNARDAGYVALGFALLGFQQLQVRRRELEKEIRRVMAERCPDDRR